MLYFRISVGDAKSRLSFLVAVLRVSVGNSEQRLRGNSRDPFLFAAHDGVNVLVLLIVFGQAHAGPGLLVQDYMSAKILHLPGLISSAKGVLRSGWIGASSS